MTKPMLDSKLLYPTEYLASEEFLGKDVTLTIKGISIDNLRMADGGVEQKPVLTFTKTDKKLVLNKTNATTIAELHCAEARDWVGKQITLFPTTCTAFGKNVDCIRIRPTVKQSQPADDKGADTSVESAPEGTILQQMQKLLTGKTVLRDDYEYALKLSQIPEGELVRLKAEAGDYKGAIKGLIDKYIETNQEVE